MENVGRNVDHNSIDRIGTYYHTIGPHDNFYGNGNAHTIGNEASDHESKVVQASKRSIFKNNKIAIPPILDKSKNMNSRKDILSNLQSIQLSPRNTYISSSNHNIYHQTDGKHQSKLSTSNSQKKISTNSNNTSDSNYL
eukprot:GHVR01063075.1.p1 GENE.GHVR01063075.1~~GHVR01063075.1.p1  ORF type:complete len:139 (+),score=6.11 GHVR01063075.1:5788-6204(+)